MRYPVMCFSDGRSHYLESGGRVVLTTGDSISLYPYYYHEFAVPKNGKGPVLIGEVSICNDDNTDNRFLNPLGGFTTIDEDAPPYRLLRNEYLTELMRKKKFTKKKILLELDKIKVVYDSSKPEKYRLLNSLTRKQKDILEALGLTEDIFKNLI